MKSKTLIINKSLIYENKMLFLFLIITLLGTTFLSTVVNTVILSKILDGIVRSDYKYMISFLEIFLIVILINASFKYVKEILEFSINKKAIYNMEDACLDHYSKLKYWNINLNSSEMMTIIDKNVSGVSWEFIKFLLNVIEISFSIVIASIYVCFLNYKVLILSIIIIMLMILISQNGIGKLPAMVNKLINDRNILYSMTWENIRNTEVIGFLNIRKVLDKFININEEYLDNWLKLKKIDNKVQLFSMFGGKFLILIIILFGINLNRYFVVDISEVFALVIIIPIICDSLFKIPGKIIELREIYSKIKIMDKVLEIETYNEELGKVYINKKIESLAFNNLKFMYPQKEIEILKDISCEIRNEFVSVVGKSGCGKSTLLRICGNLLPINKNMMYINGIDIQDFNRESLWNELGYISQKPVVMNKSLLYNITFGKKVDNYNQILNMAIEDSGLSDFVKKNGLEYEVDIKKVSNGELQKICFARMFYNSYQVFLLDEATAALDPGVENQIIDALKRRVIKDKTIVINVAHRISVLEKSDKIIVLKNGRIESVGNHIQLLNTCKYYKKLIEER